MSKELIREIFRENVFKRDGNACRICKSKFDLDAHHITDRHEMPNGGYVVENGITLCPKHHMDAEKFHMSNGEAWAYGMHPDDLYKLIGSSKEQAIEASFFIRHYSHLNKVWYDGKYIDEAEYRLKYEAQERENFKIKMDKLNEVNNRIKNYNLDVELKDEPEYVKRLFKPEFGE